MDEERKKQILRRGIECFNRRDFFECHEVLEEVWLSESAADKAFYQGLIQVACSYHHYLRGNLSGARSLLERGSHKLRAYLPARHGVNLESLLSTAREWEESFRRNHRLDAARIPRIELTE